MAGPCDCKKLGLAAGAAVVVRTVLEVLTHEVVLKSVYSRPGYAQLWSGGEPLIKARMPWIFAAHILFGTGFAWIYAHGYEEGKAPAGQGLRFGALAWLISDAAYSVVQYAIYPVSGRLAAAWMGAGLAQCLILGVVVAFLYRPAASR